MELGAKSTRGLELVSDWISCLVANSKERAVAPGLLSVVESSWVLSPACWWYGIAWYALVLCCVVYHAIAMVCHALLWYGVLKPVSRWGQCPPAGILWREICSGCSQRLYSCTAPVHAARPYCSLSRRHWLGWSNLFFVNKFVQFSFLLGIDDSALSGLVMLPCYD